MKIYEDYMNIIKDAVETDASSFVSKGLGVPGQYTKRSDDQFKALFSRIKKNEISPSMVTLSESINGKIDYAQQLGLHPDFGYLKGTEDTEDHYIVSTFIDIKGSTALFRKFDKQTVFLITNAILKAGIHTILIFGGYVHRLQGDGMFVYFGNRSTAKKDAVKNALSAVSVFTHFVKTDLKDYFQSQGIENIGIRTGIDLGHKEDVIWGNSGIGEISEVTTCSLHTSLASKMQSSAEKNGVVVGAYVKDELKNGEDYFTPVSSRKEAKDRYIFTDKDKNFYYTQYDFHWTKFLKTLDFIASDQFGNPSVKIRNYAIPIADSRLRPIAVKSKPYFGTK